MQDAETRALRRATALLIVASAVRWGWTQAGARETRSVESVLPVLTETVAHAVKEGDRRSRPFDPGETIDPNRAPAAELDRLPGVGPTTAARIVAAREAGEVFRRAEDLMRVRGIGPALLARMRVHLDLRSTPSSGTGVRSSGVGRVDVNRASAGELEALPGVGPAIAARIVAHRQGRPFQSVEELVAVQGIGPATLARLRDRVTVAGPMRR